MSVVCQKCQLQDFFTLCFFKQNHLEWVSFQRHSAGARFKARSQPWVHKTILYWIEIELFMCVCIPTCKCTKEKEEDIWKITSHSHSLSLCVLSMFLQLCSSLSVTRGWNLTEHAKNMSKSYFTPKSIMKLHLRDNSAPFRPFLHIKMGYLLIPYFAVNPDVAHLAEWTFCLHFLLCTL